MPPDRVEWIERIRVVEREHAAVRAEPVAAILLADARQRLCRFFSHLPLRW